MFDIDLTLDTILPLAEAAYGNAPMPAGFQVTSTLKLDAPIAVSHFRDMHEDPINTAFGFVAQSSDALVVSFRGTQTECEWADDFDFLWERFDPILPSIEVEQGFKKVYMALRDAVEWSGETKRLIVTGHSLGAALALLCAVDLRDRNLHPEVVTFAGPRTGGRVFREYFERAVPSCFRVVNLWDVVPHAPTELMGYVHVGTEVRVDGGFTDDLRVAHSLTSYRAGLERLKAKRAA